jgi:hypothetical protein
MSASAPPDLEAGVRRLHAEAAGVLRLVMFSASEAAVLTAAALAGDARAAGYLKALDAFRRQIDDPYQGDEARLCLSCDEGLDRSRQIMVALVIPERADPTMCIAVGLCDTCVGSQAPAAVEAMVMAALRRLLWPDLRPIAAPISAGHA